VDFHNLGRLNKAGKKNKTLEERLCYQLKHQVSIYMREREALNLSLQLFREIRFVSQPTHTTGWKVTEASR